MPDDVILDIRPLGPEGSVAPWETADPFLFCVHHRDEYPAGNDKLGPKASLAGRHIGSDFDGKDGWRMYHGDVVPGFPQHPHRGFETITVMRSGLVDHSDSLGATARFGTGDVQWMTAGKGIVHSEMFPLLDGKGPNPLELFQIWLNLPAASKLVEPHFSMLWSHKIPRPVVKDDQGRASEITVIAGRFGDVVPPAPPPHSWANHRESDLALWTVAMEPQARLTLPAAHPDSLRTLYVFRGGPLRVAGASVSPRSIVAVRPDVELVLESGPGPSEILVLQGRPIGEPVAAYGPFVMNTAAEIRQAFADYERTRFGGWPWRSDAPVHARAEGRFARHANGSVEKVDEVPSSSRA